MMRVAKQTNKLSVLAAAIGLACGGTAMAGEGAEHEYEQSQYENQQTQKDWSDKDKAKQDMEDMSANSQMNSTRLFDESTRSEHELSEFAQAVDKAGLADALTAGDYTIFAPTDEAFQAFVEERGELSTEELREVLRSHIVAGTVDAEQARRIDSARVLTGETYRINAVDDETLEIGDARIVDTDIRSGNLTVHTIDSVLTPDAFAAFERSDQVNEVEEAE